MGELWEAIPTPFDRQNAVLIPTPQSNDPTRHGTRSQLHVISPGCLTANAIGWHPGGFDGMRNTRLTRIASSERSVLAGSGLSTRRSIRQAGKAAPDFRELMSDLFQEAGPQSLVSLSGITAGQHSAHLSYFDETTERMAEEHRACRCWPERVAWGQGVESADYSRAH